MKPVQKPDYGIDAPGVRRMMILICIGGLIVFGILMALRGDLQSLWMDIGLGIAFLISVYGGGMSGYMTWKSRIGKIYTREYLLNRIGSFRPWLGNESVLDVGCGRGLMLIGAAKRLKDGLATGIDVWSNEDQSDNSPEAATENARREGVSERIKIETADARYLPFPDGSMDIVTSHWVIHNLPQVQDRFRALGEIYRVLKSGGVLAIADIDGVTEYRAFFENIDAEILEYDDGGWEARIMISMSGGSFCPRAILVRRR